ncbi:MAG: hypothetical protein ACRD1N_06445 [Terriglobia bacterium]
MREQVRSGNELDRAQRHHQQANAREGGYEAQICRIAELPKLPGAPKGIGKAKRERRKQREHLAGEKLERKAGGQKNPPAEPAPGDRALGEKKRPGNPGGARGMVIEIPQRKQRAAQPERDGREQSREARLLPLPCEAVGADRRDSEVHDVMQAVGICDRKQHDEEGERVKEQKVGIGEHRLAVVQQRVPVREMSVADGVVDKLHVRVGVVKYVAVKEHLGSEQHLPEHRCERHGEHGHGGEVAPVELEVTVAFHGCAMANRGSFAYFCKSTRLELGFVFDSNFSCALFSEDSRARTPKNNPLIVAS